MRGSPIFRRAAQALLAGALALAPLAARAETLLRDAEIERTLDTIAAPVLRAAGLSPRRVDLFILQSDQLNAFVAGGDIFLSSALLARLETVDQLQAVLAHEAAHITGGDAAERDMALRRAGATAAVSMGLAFAAAIAGGGEAAFATGAIGAQVAERSALAHSRGQEAAADQAGLRYLSAAGADPEAALDVMRILSRGDFRTGPGDTAYTRTHPLWTDRIRLLEARAAELPAGLPPAPDTAYWHARMRAKFDAFLDPPARTLERYGGREDDAAALARAVALHRLPDRARAEAALGALLAARPEDAYLHELKGQFLLENGAAAEAARAYARATELAPGEGLIWGGLGRALVAAEAPPERALDALTRARTLEQADPHALRALALAHARAGNEAAAALATAERLMLEGRVRDAAIHAARAQEGLGPASPGWQRAEDILNAARRARQR